MNDGYVPTPKFLNNVLDKDCVKQWIMKLDQGRYIALEGETDIWVLLRMSIIMSIGSWLL
jgi:hypothetical protein